ncbi:MAG: 2-amino-4-hydroxy-6-hydroxymethyldihydropteridine diphosphokinase [Cyclobacteriaceae bacterium]
MNGIYLLLGTNLGDRVSNLKMAVSLLQQSGCRVQATSDIYESEPWGISEQPAFLNQVVRADTLQEPQELLTTLLTIEKEMGRIRHIKWGERLIDLDILYYNDLVYRSETLTIPHPEIANRRFTLVPLAELAAAEVHPGNGLSQARLLEACPDKLRVWPLALPGKR